MHSSSEILVETFTDLKQKRLGTERGIKTVVLGNYFTVVELDDRCIGAAMSYYRCSPAFLRDGSTRLLELTSSDPLLEGLLLNTSINRVLPEVSAEQENLILTSILAAVVSALSSSVITAGGDETFLASPSIPFDLFEGATSAVLLGFGGYLEPLVRKEEITHLHIVDLHHPVSEMKTHIKELARHSSKKHITFSDGSDTDNRLQCAELVCITGSALCNGTMETVLNAARCCARVIVQGQSASIHPQAFFRRGVDLVATTVKPYELISCAASDLSGIHLRPYLEGSLPWMYLLPR